MIVALVGLPTFVAINFTKLKIILEQVLDNFHPIDQIFFTYLSQIGLRIEIRKKLIPDRIQESTNYRIPDQDPQHC